MTLQIVTANTLRDGLTVFLAPGGGWTAEIDGAEVAESKEDAAALEQAAQKGVAANHVVAPYLIAVERSNTGLRPTKYREFLRTKGPTVRRDLGYQAGLRPRERA